MRSRQTGERSTGFILRRLRASAYESFPTFPSCGIVRLRSSPSRRDSLRQYRPADYGVTLTCGYPFTNWVLRQPVLGHSRPPTYSSRRTVTGPPMRPNRNIVTSVAGTGLHQSGCLRAQQGALAQRPHTQRRKIPRQLNPGPAERNDFGLPKDKLVVLMVSALIPTKRVALGIKPFHAPRRYGRGG